MTIKYVTTALAVIAALLLGTSTAHAKKPLDVDCDVLASAIVCMDGILDANNVAFISVGDFFSSAILDEAVFAQLQSLILFCSDGAIDFDFASQTITTVASCRLLGLLNDEIDD